MHVYNRYYVVYISQYKKNCCFDLMFVTSQLKELCVCYLSWSRMKKIMKQLMITQAIHLDYSFKFQTTISLQCPIYYSQNDNLVFTVIELYIDVLFSAI